MGKNLMERCTRLRLFRTALFALLLITGMATVSAAPLTVSGTVTQASDGEPLIGVSTNQGHVTGYDDRYRRQLYP
ncbi:hypothetical protein [uncultured Duncaniella sp.]|uniref:hypothetical protein n=1 Tax=uncultured Duncaniella sp. TaxID=2768039 RepID=UPI0025AA03DD|nr:hypothetical protein [uncultured Duncaniella sp.]